MSTSPWPWSLQFLQPPPRRGGVVLHWPSVPMVEGVIPVFYHTAKHFRVPEDPATNMIMVGPGTGIAPFRAMLQERAATGAAGQNWLFFGEQQAKSDFFYREEFEKYQADGVLSKFDTALLARPGVQDLRAAPHPRERGCALRLV